MTPEETDDLRVHLEHYEDWAPNTHYLVTKLAQEHAEQRELIARLQLEAQVHAQEARTANATIAEIYQVVSGGKGEPGNWHGAEPVRAMMQKQCEEIERLQRALSRLRHEVAGALYMRKHEIRNVIGNTNFACLEQRMIEAEQTLTQEPT